MDPKDTLCAFCSAPATANCGHCKKVFYCSKEHQKLHRKTHKEECFPAILYRDPVIGQHWVATRNIKEGELIFNEFPIAVGPSGSVPTFRPCRPICLGCFKFIGKVHNCSSCGWPLCSSGCEKEPYHEKLECPILRKNKIQPPSNPSQYQHIFVLRCLLQKDLNPENWNLMLTLESHVEERKVKKECNEEIKSCFHFIKNMCKIKEFQFDTVNYVYGAVQFNSYALERYLKGSGVGAQLYFKLGKLNHSCVENTNALDLEPKQGKSPLSRGLSLVTCVNISKGQALTHLYDDTLLGTYPRQRFLESEYYFTCCCPRCKDSTELGTYYSAMKCKSTHCISGSSGYILPVNPVDVDSPWVCDNCKETFKYKNNIDKTIDSVSQQMKILHNEIQSGTTNIEQQITLNQKLEEFITKHEGNIVHPNHYTLVPIKLRNLQETFEIFSSLLFSMGKKSKGKRAQDANLLSKVVTETSKKINTAKEMLKVFSVISPGNSPMRGLLNKFIEDFVAMQSNLDLVK